MAQFDLYRNPSPSTRKAMPLLLAVQHDVVSETASVIVAPLAPPLRNESKLYPAFVVNGRRYMMLTPDLASLPRSVLGPPIANLGNERSKIVSALDILFVGS